MPLSHDAGTLFSKRAIIAGLGVLVVGGGVWFFISRRDTAPAYDTVQISRRDLVEEVSVTGQVQAAQELELAFEGSGKVVTANFQVGSVVQAGQIIASLDSSELAAELASSRANLASVESVMREYELALRAETFKLAELRSGSRPEELRVAETKVANAEQSLAGAKASLVALEARHQQDIARLYAEIPDLLMNAQAKAEDALVKYTEEMFSKQFADKNQLVFHVQNQINKNTTEDLRGQAFGAVDKLTRAIASLSLEQSALDASLTQAVANISTVQGYLLALNTALNDSSGVEASVLAQYKAQVSTSRSELISVTTALNAQIQAIATLRTQQQQELVTSQNTVADAQNALQLANSELVLKQSGAIPEQVQQQEARVEQANLVLQTQQARVQQAQADIQRIQAQLKNYLLLAPIDGVITRQDAKLGQIVAANTTLVTLISESAYEIIAYVPEADIAKVAINDIARLTLDAYSDSVGFIAHVDAIDPAQTTIGGVVTYKVTLHFIEEDERIRAGMTANIEMETDYRDQVLAIPSRAVISRNGGSKLVQVLNASEVTEVPVMTGLVGVDGYVEIVSGLQEGQIIVVSSRTSS